MKRIDVLILYEYLDRELDVACVLAALLEGRHGLSTRIMQHPLGQLRADSEMGRFVPRLVALPHCYQSGVHAPYLLDWPRAIYVNLMWEQLLYRGNAVVKAPEGVFSRSHVIHHAWSASSVDYLRAAGVPQDHIFLNGHPGLELYDPPYRRYYADRAALARLHGLDARRRWVFFPENYNWAFYSDELLASFIARGQEASDVRTLRDYARASFARVMPWCAALARREDVELILRPRPIIPLEDFAAAVRRLVPDIPSRLHISKAETVREWIMASDLTVSSHSTSLIEAAVAGKPAFMVTPEPIPAALAAPWHALTPRLRSQSEVEAACLDANGVARDDRLGAWARTTLMSSGDPLETLARDLADLVHGRRLRPPAPAWQDIPTPQDRPIRSRRDFLFQRLKRKRQHLSVGLSRRAVAPSPEFEKDLVSREEIRRRVARWGAILTEPR